MLPTPSSSRICYELGRILTSVPQWGSTPYTWRPGEDSRYHTVIYIPALYYSTYIQHSTTLFIQMSLDKWRISGNNWDEDNGGEYTVQISDLRVSNCVQLLKYLDIWGLDKCVVPYYISIFQNYGIFLIESIRTFPNFIIRSLDRLTEWNLHVYFLWLEVNFW